jgi:hypothetical protein
MRLDWKRPVNSRLARALLVGAGLATANLLAWTVAIEGSMPIDVVLPGVYAARPWEDVQEEARAGVGVMLDECVNCPRYAVWNRGVMGEDSLSLALLGTANALPLWLGAQRRLRYGVRWVEPGVFAVSASLQWMIVGACLSLYRSRRRRREPGSESGRSAPGRRCER